MYEKRTIYICVTDFCNLNCLHCNPNKNIMEIEFLYIPGYSPGHLCFWEKARGYLFTGDLVYKDVLFAYYPSTDPVAYLASLERISVLPAEKVFPAHHSLDIQPEIVFRMRDAFRWLKEEGKLHHGSGTFDFCDWGVWL